MAVQNSQPVGHNRHKGIRGLTGAVNRTANGGQQTAAHECDARQCGLIPTRTLGSQNVPHLLSRMAKLAAGDTGTQTVVADTDSVILEGIGEVVMALGHGTDKNRNTLLRTEGFDIILGADNGRLETHGDLAAIGGQVVGDRVLDNLEQLFLRVGGTNGKAVQQLNHQTGETLESSGNANGGVDFDQNALGCVDENLEPTGLVDG